MARSSPRYSSVPNARPTIRSVSRMSIWATSRTCSRRSKDFPKRKDPTISARCRSTNLSSTPCATSGAMIPVHAAAARKPSAAVSPPDQATGQERRLERLSLQPWIGPQPIDREVDEGAHPRHRAPALQVNDVNRQGRALEIRQHDLKLP